MKTADAADTARLNTILPMVEASVVKAIALVEAQRAVNRR